MSSEHDKYGEHALECECLTITKIAPEMCECGRLYKDRRDKDGKMMCSACYTGLSVEDLKNLWGALISDEINNIFK